MCYVICAVKEAIRRQCTHTRTRRFKQVPGKIVFEEHFQ